jgi:hypothetical protein
VSSVLLRMTSKVGPFTTLYLRLDSARIPRLLMLWLAVLMWKILMIREGDLKLKSMIREDEIDLKSQVSYIRQKMAVIVRKLVHELKGTISLLHVRVRLQIFPCFLL